VKGAQNTLCTVVFTVFFTLTARHEPVRQLLEDYARFIESSPDHVVNTVLKKNLWRDQGYRKWREQQRAQSSERAAASQRG